MGDLQQGRQLARTLLHAPLQQLFGLHALGDIARYSQDMRLAQVGGCRSARLNRERGAVFAEGD